MLQDLRFTLRLIAKDRWFSAAAVAALALGIGINAVGFSIVNAAFLRGLPFDNADRLFMLTWQGRFRSPISHPELRDWRESSRTFEGFGASRNGTMNISDARGLPEQARGTWITSNVFGLIGQPPLLGRDFSPADERKGAEPMAIISYTFWKSRYGGDPNVLGTPIRINGSPATIVGVMAEGMRFPNNTEVWAPEIPDEAREKRDARVLDVFGLLRPGSSRPEARTEMDAIAKRLIAADPEEYKNTATVRVETFTERYVGGAAKTMFWAMMGAVGFILLIACANVANLLLSRSASRAREIGIRTALGASRWRIIRQLLFESLVLAVIGGSLGLFLTYAGVQAFDAAISDPGKPFWIDFRVDTVVLGYVAGICVVTALLFGLAPALHVSRSGSSEVLKEGGRGTVGNRRASWLSGTMVVIELALTVVLLAGAGLMVRSFMNLERFELGFPTDHVVTMQLKLPEAKYATPDARAEFYGRLTPRLAAIPGVESVAVTTTGTALPRLWPRLRGRWPCGRAERRRPAAIGGRDDQSRVLRRAVGAVASRPGLQRRRWRARLGGCHRQPAVRRTVLPRRRSDRAADPIRQPGRCARRAGSCVEHDCRHQPDHPSRRDAAGGKRPRDLRAAAAGATGGGVLDRAQPAAARIARGSAAPRGAGGRCGSAALHHPDAAADDGRGAVALPALRRDVRNLRHGRAGVGVTGSLCRDGVCGHATHAGDRRADGTRRAAASGDVDGAAAGTHSGRHRTDDWRRRCGPAQPGRRARARRAHAERSDDVPLGRCHPDDCCRRRLPRAGAPRHAHRSPRGASRGLKTMLNSEC